MVIMDSMASVRLRNPLGIEMARLLLQQGGCNKSLILYL